MRRNKNFFLSISFLCWGFFIFSFHFSLAASPKDLIITEIMYDPEGKDDGHSDWLEIYNPKSDKITIKKEEFGLIDEENIELGKDGVYYASCHSIKEDLEISPGEFIIIADNKSDFESDYLSIKSKVLDSSFSLSSKGDYIRLSDDKCATFFISFSYKNSWGGNDNGKTLEKKNYKDKYDSEQWQESYISGGTPGEKSSEKPKPKTYSDKVIINEVLPNPSGEDDEEYIELFNESGEDVNLSGWELRDSSKTGKYVFPEENKIKASSYLTIYKENLKFAINNSEEKLYLFNPNGKEVDSVSFKESAKDNISYNFDGKKWRWSKFLTPGEENKFNSLPQKSVKIQKKVYKNMLAEFESEASDGDNDELKFTWNFGDGHKSYKANTSHKYEKKGTYKVSLEIFDGSEKVVEEFNLVVGSFPSPKVKIKEVSANPKGKDTDKKSGEYIVIQNKSKKEINLKGWSVATGWESLYNHPISEDFKIKPGKEKKLTRKYSNFTLNNKKTKIELRYPDGEIAHAVKYNKKKESVEDDETYKKTENGWEWEAVILNESGSSNNREPITVPAEIIYPGTQEETPIQEIKKENEIIEIENNSREESAETIQKDAGNQGQVLGKDIQKAIETKKEDGKARKIFYSVFQKINQIINNILNLLF